MNNQLEKTQKEAVETSFKVLARHFPERTEEQQEKPQSG
jgi:hypothetical protein